MRVKGQYLLDWRREIPCLFYFYSTGGISNLINRIDIDVSTPFSPVYI